MQVKRPTTSEEDADSLWQGFAATLTPESLQSFESLTGGVIDYIGMYIQADNRSVCAANFNLEPDGVVTTQ